MPFPIGHTAIGLVAFETAQSSPDRSSRLAQMVFITLLANLPDLDVFFGLIVAGDGGAFHRGPTHSLLFAILCGYAASHMWRLWPRIPRFGFGLCSLLIFSHVAADMFLSTAPVSLFWPLEIFWSADHSTWDQVIDMVLFPSSRDAGFAAAAMLYVLALRFIRGVVRGQSFVAFARKRFK